MRLLFAIVLCVGSVLPSLAAAQPATRDVAVARRDFQAGIQAARAGEWDRARDHFARSYAINPRLSALFNLAGAQAHTGELVAAAESYREYLGRRDEATPGNIAEAERLLAELEAKIPTLRLRIDNLEDGDEVMLGDTTVNRLLLGEPMPLDPGEHRITIRRDSAELIGATVVATEGARLETALVAPQREAQPPPEAPPDVGPPPLEPAPLPELGVSDLPADAEPSSPSSPPREDDSGTVFEQWWFWTIVGVVVIGGAIGIYFAVPPTEAPPNRGFPGAPLEVR